MDKIREEIRKVAGHLIAGEADAALRVMQRAHDEIEASELSREDAAILRAEVDRIGQLAAAAIEGVAAARTALVEAYNGAPLNVYGRDGRVEKSSQRITPTVRY